MSETVHERSEKFATFDDNNLFCSHCMQLYKTMLGLHANAPVHLTLLAEITYCLCDLRRHGKTKRKVFFVFYFLQIEEKQVSSLVGQSCDKKKKTSSFWIMVKVFCPHGVKSSEGYYYEDRNLGETRLEVLWGYYMNEPPFCFVLSRDSAQRDSVPARKVGHRRCWFSGWHYSSWIFFQVIIPVSVVLASLLHSSLSEPLKFLAIGDWGDNDGNQYQVARAMAAWAETRQPIFILTLGDNFYPSGVESTEDVKWDINWQMVRLTLYKTNVFFPRKS